MPCAALLAAPDGTSPRYGGGAHSNGNAHGGLHGKEHAKCNAHLVYVWT